MAGEIILPPGFRFSPTGKELLEFYLKPKVLGQTLPCKIIKERQVFGANANPWRVFDPDSDCWMVSEVSPEKFEKVMYVFTHLTKKATSTDSLMEKKKGDSERENFCRTAGCGTWSGKSRPKPVKDDKGRVIGERRYLVFQINEITADFDFNKVGGKYRMHEYSLLGVDQNIVVSRITLDQSKNTDIKLAASKTTKPKKSEKKIDEKKKDETTKANKSEKKINSKIDFTRGSVEEGVYLSEVVGQDQSNILEIGNSTSDHKLSVVEGTDHDHGLPVGAITTDNHDLIVYDERVVVESVVEDGDGSQVMEINCYHEDDIEAIWNTLSSPNLDDVMVNAIGDAGINETRRDSTLYALGEEMLNNNDYLENIIMESNAAPSTSCPADLYFDIEALLNDLNSKGEEPAVFENSRSKLLGKRKLVAEISHEAKRLCL